MTYDRYCLREVAQIITGKTPPTAQPENFGGEIPFVTPAELDSDSGIKETPRTLSVLGASFVKSVPQASTLVCCIGSLGKVGYAGRELATNQQINSVIFDPDKVDPRYGFWSIKQLKRELLSVAPATTVPIVSKSLFEQLKIPLPPLPEQKRIAAILDQAAELVRLRKEALAKLDTLGQAIFQQTLVDNVNFIPFGKLVTEFRYGTSTKSGSEGLPTLRIPNIIGGEIQGEDIKFVKVTSAEKERLVLRDGDLLFVRSNGNPDYVGRCASFSTTNISNFEFGSDWIFASYLIRARLCSEVEPNFASAYFASDIGRRAVRSRAKTSAGQYNVNTESLASIPFPDLAVADQVKFSRQIEGVLECKKIAKSALIETRKLLESTQQKAFRGEI